MILKEAIVRTLEPPEVHHERLFVISVLGFLVNLVGIFVFQHGGQCSHSHGGSDSHNHSHEHHDHNHNHAHHNHHDHNSHGFSHFSSPTTDNKQQIGSVALDMNSYVKSYPATDHHADHPHLHSYDQNETDNGYSDTAHLIPSTNSIGKTHINPQGHLMQSVLLHIIADTLGSVGVMISAILMNQFGWLIADPICSIFIAILISISVYPLLRDSTYILLQRIPYGLEDKLPQCLAKIQKIPGVKGLQEVHFWTLNSEIYVGCLKLEVAHDASQRNILQNSKVLLNQIGVEKYHIQIDQI